MSEHLCEFKVPSDKPKSDMVLYRIYELVFEFEDYMFSVNGDCICNVTITQTEDIVIEQLQYQGNYNSEDSSYQSYLHTGCHHRRIDVAGHLYLVERHNHTYYRTQKAQRRSDSYEKGYPGASFLEVSHLHRAIRVDAPLYVFEPFVYAQRTFITYRGYRSACLPT